MPADKDQLFIDIALEKGLLTQEQVDECAQAHTQATQLGVKITFTKLAQDRGLLSKDQITDIRREMAKRGVLPEFGGYELISKLGQGGMGAVYKARQIKLDRVVALKVLPAEMAANRQYIARFEREARLAAKVLHPNAVQVFDVGQEGVRHYIAMEFVDGSDVAKELTGGPMAEDRALQIIRGVAEALAVAHEQKIVHRDIKPANIMLTSRGTPKVADLGIAKQTGVHGGTLTRTGAAIGTPHYMSPEQCLGQKDIDCRSDIYSLGATLFHMVCGARPFEADTAMAVMRKQVDEASPDPREKNPNLSDASAALIWRMMAKDREARFQTCAELIEAVDEILKGAGHAFIHSAEIDGPRRRPKPKPPSRETTAKEASPVTSTRAGQAAAGTVLRTAADQPETVPAAATPKSLQWLVAVVGVLVLIVMAGVVGFMIYRSMRTLPSPTPRKETAKPRPAEAPAAVPAPPPILLGEVKPAAEPVEAQKAKAPKAAPAGETDEVIFYDDFSNGLARWEATATVRSTKDGVVDYSCGRHTGIRWKGEIPVENVVIQWRGAAFQNGFAAHFGPYYVDIGGWNNTASATCGPGAPQRIKRTGRVWKPGHFHIYEIRRVGDDLIGAIDGKVVIRRQITARSKSGRLRFTTWNARLKIDWVRVIRKQPKTKPAAAAVDESKSASAPSASRAEAPSPELDKGLVAHYALEGNLRDHTPNRNDGSASGHVRYVQGVTGQALQFGGVKSPAHVMIRKSPSLALGNEMAMSFFLRVDDPTAHDGWGKPISYRGQQYVFAADGDGAGICLFVYVDKASRLTCQFKNMKTHTTPLFLIDAAMDYRLHDWVHVAAVHNGKDAILYLNGNETARKSAPANLHTAGGKNVFLGRMGTHWYPLNGAIDDFRWYNRALSPNEVRALAATVAQPRVGKTVETRRGVPADRAASTELRIELSGVRGWSLGRVARGQRISTSRHYVFTSFPSEIANVAHVRRPHSQICHGLPGGAVRLSRDAWAYVAVNTYYKTRPVGVKEVARMRRSGWKTVSGRFSTTTTGRERWGWTLFRKRVSKGPVTLPAVKLGTSKIFMFK